MLYFPYESVVAGFAAVGLDAAFDEDTPDATLRRRVEQYEKLSTAKKDKIAAFLRKRHKGDLAAFSSALRVTLTRKIESVYVLPLHGAARTLGDVAQAIVFIETFDESKPDGSFTRYEVGVRYNNGDEIRGQFKDKATTIAFLQGIH